MRSSSAKTDAPTPLPEKVLVGRITRPHGVRGEVVVDPATDHEERFAPGSTFELGGPTATRRLTVQRARSGPTGWIVAFAGVADRNAAEALRGTRLEVPRSQVPAPPEGSYYVFELIGATAGDRNVGELGEVIDVIETPGGWLLIVDDGAGRRLTLPFVERFLMSIDRESRRIEWDLPEGLIEACASRS